MSPPSQEVRATGPLLRAKMKKLATGEETRTAIEPPLAASSLIRNPTEVFEVNSGLKLDSYLH